ARRRARDRGADCTVAQHPRLRENRGAADPRARPAANVRRYPRPGHDSMKPLLGAPIAAAAACAMAVALADRLSPWVAAALAIVLALACGVLAAASADRPRRLCWSAAALTACVAGVTSVVGPLPGFDLRLVGPFDGLREALADPLRRLPPEPESGIVRGVVLGERTSVDADLSAAFARSGTTHLLAISGFNMTLVAAAVSMVVRGRLPAAATAVSTIFCVVAYSLLV